VVLRLADDDALLKLRQHALVELEPEREELVAPQVARGRAGRHEDVLLRGDVTAVHDVVHPVDRAAGHLLAHVQRPDDRVAAAVQRQQAGVVADRAQPRLLARLAADEVVAVRRADQVDPVRQRVGVELARLDPEHAVLLGVRPQAVRLLAVAREGRRADAGDLVPAPGAQFVDLVSECLLAGDEDAHCPLWMSVPVICNDAPLIAQPAAKADSVCAPYPIARASACNPSDTATG
jgi:hypothetical protein